MLLSSEYLRLKRNNFTMNIRYSSAPELSLHYFLLIVWVDIHHIMGKIKKGK